MALEIQFEDSRGTVYPKAYARIDRRVHETKSGKPKMVSLNVCVYGSKNAKNNGKMPVWGPQNIEVSTPDPANPGQMICAVDADTVKTAELYAWMKTLPMFTGAADA